MTLCGYDGDNDKMNNGVSNYRYMQCHIHPISMYKHFHRYSLGLN